MAIAAGVKFARELGNLPPNICNPGYLADQATESRGDFDKAQCEVLEREQMQELGMGSLLAVSRGSANPPKLDRAAVQRRRRRQAVRAWSARASPSTPAASTSSRRRHRGNEVRHVRRRQRASARSSPRSACKLPINLVVIVPAVENMPDADAYRPCDIMTSDVAARRSRSATPTPKAA